MHFDLDAMTDEMKREMKWRNEEFDRQKRLNIRRDRFITAIFAASMTLCGLWAIIVVYCIIIQLHV
jgi:hypothetical protein